MKKIIAISLTLIMVILLTACGAESPSTVTDATTTESSKTAETVSTETLLLEKLLASEFYLGLADEEYKEVVNYIKNNTPEKDSYGDMLWYLDDYTLELNNSNRSLRIGKNGDWETLCENIDYPNVLTLGDTSPFTVINNMSFYDANKSIEVWSLGEEIWKVNLPSYDVKIIGTINIDNTIEIFVRSNNTIGSILWKNDNDFKYTEIISDCAGPVEKTACSLWYVNKDAELIHVNLISKDKQSIAQNITSLVDVHDGTYSVAWREKGSLEWHDPTFFISYDGKTTDWSEHPGM